jgi:hypothetical protein
MIFRAIMRGVWQRSKAAPLQALCASRRPLADMLLTGSWILAPGSSVRTVPIPLPSLRNNQPLPGIIPIGENAFFADRFYS